VPSIDPRLTSAMSFGPFGSPSQVQDNSLYGQSASQDQSTNTANMQQREISSDGYESVMKLGQQPTNFAASNAQSSQTLPPELELQLMQQQLQQMVQEQQQQQQQQKHQQQHQQPQSQEMQHGQRSQLDGEKLQTLSNGMPVDDSIQNVGYGPASLLNTDSATSSLSNAGPATASSEESAGTLHGSSALPAGGALPAVDSLSSKLSPFPVDGLPQAPTPVLSPFPLSGPPLAPTPVQHCAPQCFYKCEDVRCDEVCEPTCKPAKCETRCKNVDLSGCSEDCSTPQCRIDCPLRQCASASCPHCKTKCGKPSCILRCPKEQPCNTVCEQPACTWKCHAPEHCPKPACQMFCQHPPNCMASTYLAMPPLQLGEVRVQRFTVSPEEAAELLQLQRVQGSQELSEGQQAAFYNGTRIESTLS